MRHADERIENLSETPIYDYEIRITLGLEIAKFLEIPNPGSLYLLCDCVKHFYVNVPTASLLEDLKQVC